MTVDIAPLIRLTLGLGLLAATVASEAQPVAKVYRIGFIFPGPLAPRMLQWDTFRQALRELGYTEGRNIILELRSPAHEGDPLGNLAAELVRLEVDLIVAVADRTIRAVREATSTIPIVMCPSTDAVEQGFVASLARPGGNVTGVSLLNTELIAKRLEMLREIVPKVSRVAVFWSPGGEASLRAAELAARAIRVEVVNLKVSRAEDLDTGFETAVKSRAGALLVPSSPTLFGLRARLAELALKHRLPAMYMLPSFAHAGGLVAYGPSDTEYYRRAATYVDKLLKGRRPADLPVEQPTRFDLVINLKTAKALGIRFPQSILLRATEAIQ